MAITHHTAVILREITAVGIFLSVFSQGLSGSPMSWMSWILPHFPLSSCPRPDGSYFILKSLKYGVCQSASLNLTFCLNWQELLPLCWASDADLVPESAGQDLCSQVKHITSEWEVRSCTASLLPLVWKRCRARLCWGLNMLFDCVSFGVFWFVRL